LHAFIRDFLQEWSLPRALAKKAGSKLKDREKLMFYGPPMGGLIFLEKKKNQKVFCIF
jgi:hypothetical protein